MAFRIPLGELFVRLTGDAKKFEQMLDQAENRLQQAGQRITALGAKLTAGLTVPLAGLALSSVKAASDAEEIRQKFDVVFSEISSKANAMANELDDAYGLSATGAREVLSSTGDLLAGFGFTQRQALDLSNQVAKLGTDLASFQNLEGGAERATKILTAGMLGQRQAMKALGIAVNERTPEFKNLVKEIQATQGVTLTQAKALATLRLAFIQSENAIGDWARTNDSLANQLRELEADFRDFREELGKEFLPVAKDVVATSRDLLKEWKALSKEEKELAVQTAIVVAAIGPMLVVVGLLVQAYAALTTVVAAGSLVWIGYAGVILLVAAALALVTDAILQFTEQGNLGILDMVNNFRIGGTRISTWMQVAALLSMKAWEEFFTFVKKGLISFQGFIRQMIFRVRILFLRLAQFIAVKFIEGLQRALGFFGLTFMSKFKAGIDSVNSFFEGQIGKVSSGMLDDFTDTYGKIGKLDADFKKKAAEFDTTIAETFKKDAEKVKKEQIKLAAGAAAGAAAIASAAAGAAKAAGGPGGLAAAVGKAVGGGIKKAELRRAQEFQQISLQRFSLQGLARAQERQEQQVKAKGVEERLDKLISVTEQKNPVARAG